MKPAQRLRPLVLTSLAAVALLGVSAAQVATDSATAQDAAQEVVAQEAGAAADAAADAAEAAGQAAPAPAAQQPAQGMGELRIPGDELARACSVLGGEGVPEAIVVGEAELRRALVYQHGMAALESRKLDIYIEEEKSRQIEAGADPAKFDIPDADVEAAIQETMDQVKAQYPTLEAASVLRHNSIDPNDMARATRQGKLFDMVFLPDDARDWPPTTTEALKSKMGDEFIAKLVQGAEEREATGVEDPAAAQGQGLFKMLMRQQLRGTLDEVADIEYASDGLPAEIAMRVNGVDVSVDEVYPSVRAMVSQEDVEATREFVHKAKLIESALAQAGALMDEETAAAAYAEHIKPEAEATLFPFESIVLQFKGFPSMEVYRQYWTLLESYRRMVADEVNDESLTGYMAERGNGMLNLARVDAEVLLLSAFDFENDRWKENGWADAAERAAEVVASLSESGGENWDELLEAYSDFWDPPTPAGQAAMGAPPAKKNKGRFGLKYRNELLRELGESDYSLFLSGSSVSDEVFYNLEAGALGGPYKGPHGYYIARIVSKMPPQRATTIADENIRKMASEDYVSTRFNAFARELTDAALGQ